MASLQGKVIAITGAASGIGRALSEICASRGAKLALADIQQEALGEVVSEIKSTGVDVVGTTLDVSSNQAVDDWISSTVKHFGRLDGAANVAGIDYKTDYLTDFTEVTNEEWDYILGVNLTGLMFCLRAELRVMGHGASVVNVSSIAGLIGRQGLGAYSASKQGVVGMTRTVAKDVGPRGIRVNAIAPGPIETPMLKRLIKEAGNKGDHPVTKLYSTLPLRRLAQPAEAAKLIAFLLSDDASFITGALYPVDGGATC